MQSGQALALTSLQESTWNLPDLGVNGVLRTPFTPKSGGLPRQFLETDTIYAGDASPIPNQIQNRARQAQTKNFKYIHDRPIKRSVAA